MSNAVHPENLEGPSVPCTLKTSFGYTQVKVFLLYQRKKGAPLWMLDKRLLNGAAA